jgi:hypothetical protein
VRRRVWLIVLCCYAIAGAIDTTDRVVEVRRAGAPLGLAPLAVAFCGGLFWPLDIAARPFLGSR